MPRSVVRIHVVIPSELIDAVDKRVSSRKRSDFVAEAIAEKLARLRLAEAVREAEGSLSEVDIPGWETSESAADWVRVSRKSDAERLNRQQHDR